MNNYGYEVKYWDANGNLLCVEVVVAAPEDWRYAERMVLEQSHVTTVESSVFLGMTDTAPGIQESTVLVLREAEPE